MFGIHIYVYACTTYVHMYISYVHTIDARSQAKTLHLHADAEAEAEADAAAEEAVLKEARDSTRYLEGNMTASSRNVASQSCLLATGWNAAKFLLFVKLGRAKSGKRAENAGTTGIYSYTHTHPNFL